jgi:hypothetical protein
MTPPAHDLDAERSVLGFLMRPTDEGVALLSDLRPEDFYGPAHDEVFRSILRLVNAGAEVDTVTIADDMRAAKTLDKLGGVAQLISIQTHAALTSTVGRHAQIIKRAAHIRRLVGGAEKVLRAHQKELPAEEIDRLAREVYEEAQDLGAPTASTLGREDVGAAMLGEAIGAVPPSGLRRTDGQGLLYEAQSHAIQGEPSSGKTWVGLVAASQEIAQGRTVLWLDYETSCPRIAQRLLALGADPDLVRKYFVYLRWPRLDHVGLAQLASLVAAESPVMIVVDSMAKALQAQDLDEDRAPEILEWWGTVGRVLRTGTETLVLLDHVVKANDSRGRYARGSGAKLAETDVALILEIVKPWSRELAGHARLKVAKDRDGYLGAPGTVVAIVRFDPLAGGGVLEIRVDPPEADGGRSEAKAEREAELDQAIVELVRDIAPTRVSQTELESRLNTLGYRARHETVREAAQRLAADPTAPVEAGTGARGALVYGYRAVCPAQLDIETPEPSAADDE